MMSTNSPSLLSDAKIYNFIAAMPHSLINPALLSGSLKERFGRVEPGHPGHLAQAEHLHLLPQKADHVGAQAVPYQVDLLHPCPGLKSEEKNQESRVFSDWLGSCCGLQVVEVFEVSPVDGEHIVVSNGQVRWGKEFSKSDPIIVPASTFEM